MQERFDAGDAFVACRTRTPRGSSSCAPRARRSVRRRARRPPVRRKFVERVVALGEAAADVGVVLLVLGVHAVAAEAFAEIDHRRRIVRRQSTDRARSPGSGPRLDVTRIGLQHPAHRADSVDDGVSEVRGQGHERPIRCTHCGRRLLLAAPDSQRTPVPAPTVAHPTAAAGPHAATHPPPRPQHSVAPAAAVADRADAGCAFPCPAPGKAAGDEHRPSRQDRRPVGRRHGRAVRADRLRDLRDRQVERQRQPQHAKSGVARPRGADGGRHDAPDGSFSIKMPEQVSEQSGIDESWGGQTIAVDRVASTHDDASYTFSYAALPASSPLFGEPGLICGSGSTPSGTTVGGDPAWQCDGTGETQLAWVHGNHGYLLRGDYGTDDYYAYATMQEIAASFSAQ